MQEIKSVGGSQKNSAKNSPLKVKHEASKSHRTSKKLQVQRNSSYASRIENNKKYRNVLQENIDTYEVSQKDWLQGLIDHRKYKCYYYD